MFYLGNATNFLLQAIIAFALYVVLLRFWMQWVRADFRNELGHFIITVTNPAVIPLRKIIPSIGTLDTATIVLACALAATKLFAACLTLQLAIPDPITYVLITLGIVIKYSIYLFIGAILVQIVVSWVNPYSQHPVVSIAHSIANPILAPARRLIAPIGGLDLSPMIVLLFLNFLLYLIMPALLQGRPV